jgi:hypothetical protein
MKKYIYNILVAIDQFLNALFCGDPDETISSRAGKRHPWLARWIDWFFLKVFKQPNHSAASVVDDEGNDSVPPSQRWQVVIFWVVVISIVLLSGCMSYRNHPILR